MNRHYFRSLTIISSCIFISGCVGYANPYPHYSVPMARPYVAPNPVQIMPFGNYNPYNASPRGYEEHERGYEHENRAYGPYRRHEDRGRHEDRD